MFILDFDVPFLAPLLATPTVAIWNSFFSYATLNFDCSPNQSFEFRHTI